VLIELAAKTHPEGVILDIAMPQLNGMEAAAQIRRKQPAVKIIFLTVNQDLDIAAEAIRLGASGVLLKSSAATELIAAITLALEDKTYLTPLITKGKPLGVFLNQAARPAAEKLTARQREVLQLLAEGKQMKEAAAMLKLTPRTITFHKFEIMEQLGLKTGAELVQYAVKHRIVSPHA
jgi:DNA-binding NarL/FixJ family response regulator